jgi:hypothetical protein
VYKSSDIPLAAAWELPEEFPQLTRDRMLAASRGFFLNLESENRLNAKNPYRNIVDQFPRWSGIGADREQGKNRSSKKRDHGD